MGHASSDGAQFIWESDDLCERGEHMKARPNVPGRQRPWLQAMVTLAVAAFIGWGCLVGTTEVVENVRSGVLHNRKGPDILAAERPVLYWALIGFYAAAMLTAAGLALMVMAIAVRDLISAKDPDR